MRTKRTVKDMDKIIVKGTAEKKKKKKSVFELASLIEKYEKKIEKWKRQKLKREPLDERLDKLAASLPREGWSKNNHPSDALLEVAKKMLIVLSVDNNVTSYRTLLALYHEFIDLKALVFDGVGFKNLPSEIVQVDALVQKRVWGDAPEPYPILTFKRFSVPHNEVVEPKPIKVFPMNGALKSARTAFDKKTGIHKK